MSLTKHLCIFYLLSGLFFFISCEDNKKASDGKTETTSQTDTKKNDELSTKESEVISEKENSDLPDRQTGVKQYPRITNENVVDFLTEYGIENPESRVRITTQHGDIVLLLPA